MQCARSCFSARRLVEAITTTATRPKRNNPYTKRSSIRSESYADAYDFDYSGKFILSVNKNAEYVTDGAASLYFTVDETRAGKSVEGTFNVPAYRMDGSKDYRDFSKVSRVTYDV